jgi:nitrogen regulatory protein PII
MKLVVAVVRPEECNTVQAALERVGVCYLMLSEVWGQSPEPGPTLIYRSSTFRERWVRRSKVEAVVDDHAVDAVVEAIENCTDMRQVGEGAISVVPLEHFVHIGDGPRAGRLDRGARTTESVHQRPSRQAAPRRGKGTSPDDDDASGVRRWWRG